MAARKKAKRKAAKRTVARRPSRARRVRRRAPPRARRKAAASPGELVVRVAQQMAGVVERGLGRTLKKLPTRGTTARAKEMLKDAIGALRRQADAIREQAETLANRGAEGPAGIWRSLAGRLDRAVAELKRRLA